MSPPTGGSDADNAAIINVAAYIPSKIDMGIMAFYVKPNDIALSFLRPSDAPIISTSTASNQGLGTLSVLPTELICDILCKLDIDSYLRFRRVSRRARHLASDVPEYRVVITQATTCVMAMIQTELASWTTFTDLFSAMTGCNCIHCGSVADFLYIPTVSRICDKCLADDDIDPEDSPFTTLDLKILARHASSWPDRAYRMLRKKVPMARLIDGVHDSVNLHKAREVVALRRVERLGWNMDEDTDEVVALPILETRKFCVVVPFYQDQKAFTSLACRGCMTDYVYPSEKAFMGHFAQCPRAQRIWETDKVEGGAQWTMWSD